MGTACQSACSNGLYSNWDSILKNIKYDVASIGLLYSIMISDSTFAALRHSIEGKHA